MEVITITIITVIFLNILTHLLVKGICAGLKENPDKVPRSIKLRLLTVILMLPIATPIFLILALYRQILHLVLRWKYGSKFGGLLSGCDNIFTLKIISKSPSCILHMVKYNYSNDKSFYDAFREVLYTNLLPRLVKSPKCFATVRSYFGYSFLLKNEFTLDDSLGKLQPVKNVEREIQRSDLVKLINDYCDRPLPNNGRGLWDILVGTQPVKWNQQPDGVLLYPVLFRMHHSLADMLSIVDNVFETFPENNSSTKENVGSSTAEQKTNQQCSNESAITFLNDKVEKELFITTFVNIWKKVKAYWVEFSMFCLGVTNFIKRNLYLYDKANALRGLKLKNKRMIVLSTEDTSRYLKIVKRIQSRISGIRFSDILLTCISESFREYLQKLSTEVPKYMMFSIPQSPRVAKKKMTAFGRAKGNILNCHNVLPFIGREIPISQKKETILNLALVLKERDRYYTHPVAVEGNYQQYEVISGLLPRFLMQFYMDSLQYTGNFSNAPVSKYLKFQDFVVEDIIGIGPVFEGIGINFVLSSYPEKMNISLAVDKAVIPEEYEIREILNNVYKYLDLLDKETETIGDVL